jgi:hypothetical protein
MISRLFSHCLLGHGQRITTRIDGVLSYQCERCHQVLGPVLAGQMITNPLRQSVAGQPLIKAKRVTRANVAAWKRSSSR